MQIDINSPFYNLKLPNVNNKYYQTYIMNENIELKSFSKLNTENVIEEYHEINEDIFKATEATPDPSSVRTQPIQEFQFFTEYDIKSAVKKKKAKNKDKTAKFKDLIASELSINPLITENIITITDNDMNRERHKSYLETSSVTRRLFREKSRHDMEHGWGKQYVKLSPIFPKVLENITFEGPTIPVEYVEPTMFEFINDQMNKESSTTRFLDVAIKDIKFNHHHLYSLESLLSMKLLVYYDDYKKIQKLLKDLSKNIKVCRDTKDNLKHDLVVINASKKDDVKFDSTVRHYTAELLENKRQYLKALSEEKEIIHRLKSLWSDIEMVREKTGCIKTPYIFDITRNVTDQTEYEKEWNQAYNVEFTDMLDKIEYEFVSEYIEYKEVKSNLKTEKQSKVKPNKPKLNIDEESVKKAVEIIVNNLVDEEKVNIVLRKDDNILNCVTNNSTNSKFKKNEYYFEIYIDDVFVCESEHYISTDITFNVYFTEKISAEILPSNKKLVFVLLENDERVSSLTIFISQIIHPFNTADTIEHIFIYEKTLECNNKHVGDGSTIKEIAAANKVRLKSSNLFNGQLSTNCAVSIKVGWNENLNSNFDKGVCSSMAIGRRLKRLQHGIEKPNLDTMSELITKLYDRDISNDENMINMLNDMCKGDAVVKQDYTFSVDENSPEFVRHKLLHLRNIGAFTNIDNKLVPVNANEISTEQLNCLQKTHEIEFDMNYLQDKQLEMDPIELQRYINGKYMEKLNIKMLRNLNEHLLNKTYKDVVRDFKDFSFRSIFSNQTAATLSTITSSTKLQMLSESLNKEQDIYVSVLRAFNLLDRSSAILEDNEEADQIAGIRVRPLRPFVKISYHGVTGQTNAGIGCHPSWNHTLKISSKLDPVTTIHINLYDEYKANITAGYAGEDYTQDRTVHYRYHNRWLGTVAVPLYTVLSLGALRGTFKISTPPLLFGYETLPKGDSASFIPEIVKIMKKTTSYITLSITTSLSHLGGLQAYHQPLPNNTEDDYLIRHLNNFVTDYLNDFPQRNISLTFIDSAGRNKCVTQFLQPILAPDDILSKHLKARSESAVSKSSGFSRSSSSKSKDLERGSLYEESSEYSAQDNWRKGDEVMKAIDVCLRYVALIPTYEVAATHVVTLMGLELLKVVHGSPLDHTILLASFFLYLGIKCWVITGTGLPRGPSSYVLIKYNIITRRIVLTSDQVFKRGFLSRSEGYTWYVCDASTGERHELRDVGCPLKTIDYVFDYENIWVNMQTSQECESMSFDFSRSSDWQPVFDKSMFVMKHPIASDASIYTTPSNVDSLRHLLESKIKGKLQKWRSHIKTIWNRYCSSLLRETLSQWEHWAFNQNDAKPALSHKLKQLMVTYKLFGFPLNMPYLSTKSVLSAVKSTGMHLNEDPNVEFALGVEVFAYPNNVISVWVFLASISRV